MKPVFARIALPIIFILILLAPPALAQTALAITSVQPDTVSSAASASLTIAGAGFQNGAVVSLPGFGSLVTAFVSDASLTASLPAGVPPGVYSLTVTNPDQSSATLPNALVVEQPVPTQDDPDDSRGTATPYVRPLVVVETYSAGEDAVRPGQDFTLVVRLENVGGREAVNLIATFTPGDLVPRVSGGVLARIEMQPGEKKKFEQPMTAPREIAGKSIVTAVMQLSYNDLNGTAYTETFNLTLPVTWGGGVSATATPTPTGTASPRPQLVITSYSTDTELLKPGTRFMLQLEAQNMGNGIAKRTTMIIGGGTSSSGGVSGTPDPGGVSGGSGEFGNFAPVAASNVQFLGDIGTGESISAGAALIVNSKTEPGAYPMKITFTYTAENGNVYNDDQVITLLVYSPPTVEVNYYQDPGPIFAGQPNRLPLQVVNLGRKATVLGNMEITAQGAELTQNSVLIGPLDTGGYYTLDATLIPSQPGPLELLVTIDYTDDFNLPQVITKTIAIDVQEMMMPEPVTPEPGSPGMEGGPVGPGSSLGPETLLQKVWRFVRGLVGLDSGQASPGSPGEMPPGEMPSEGIPGGKHVPAPMPGTKG